MFFWLDLFIIIISSSSCCSTLTTGSVTNIVTYSKRLYFTSIWLGGMVVLLLGLQSCDS